METRSKSVPTYFHIALTVLDTVRVGNNIE